MFYYKYGTIMGAFFKRGLRWAAPPGWYIKMMKSSFREAMTSLKNYVAVYSLNCSSINGELSVFSILLENINIWVLEPKTTPLTIPHTVYAR